MVPILSYAALHGKCRACGVRIDRRHFAVELAAATLGLVALVAHPLPLAAITLLLGLWLLLLALLDLEHQWLPDRLTLPLVPLGLAAAWAGFGPPLLERAIGAAAGWAALFLIAWPIGACAAARDGGGDPRLLAGIGAWVGVLQLPFVLLGAGLLGLGRDPADAAARGGGLATTRLPLGTPDGRGGLADLADDAGEPVSSLTLDIQPLVYLLLAMEEIRRAALFPRGAARPIPPPSALRFLRLRGAAKAGNVPTRDSSGKGRRFSHPIQDDEALRSSANCLDRVTWRT
jgi:leader peptidase (prepilin peptidase)/N-methyltransferase